MTKICKNCEQSEEKHIKEITRKNRKDVEVLYCHSIDELKEKRVDWDCFINEKFRK